MTIAELNAIRDKMKKVSADRQPATPDSIKIVVGMGECGVEAGARKVLDAFLGEIEDNGIEKVVVCQSGCMGKCEAEPTVEVYVPGEEKVTYGYMTEEKAKRVMKEHILGKKTVAEYVLKD